MSHGLNVLAVFFGLLPVFCSGQETAVIIDDSDPGFTDINGNSPVQTTPGPFSYNGSAHHSVVVGDPAPVIHVSWTFQGLDPDREYDVAATWNFFYPANNLKGDAAYTITGASTQTLHLRHNVAPAPDYTETDDAGNAHDFQTLGTVKPKADGTIVLELTDEDGIDLEGVVADAALVMPLPPRKPPVLGLDHFDTVANRLHLTLQGLEAGATYVIESSATLDGDFADTGVRVTESTSQPFQVPADEQNAPRLFFRARKE